MPHSSNSAFVVDKPATLFCRSFEPKDGHDILEMVDINARSSFSGTATVTFDGPRLIYRHSDHTFLVPQKDGSLLLAPLRFYSRIPGSQSTTHVRFRKSAHTTCDGHEEYAGTGILRFVDSTPPEWYMRDSNTSEGNQSPRKGQEPSRQTTAGTSFKGTVQSPPTLPTSDSSTTLRPSTPGLESFQGESSRNANPQQLDATDIWSDVLNDPMFSNMDDSDA